MNVHKISFFMQHNVICLNEGKMYRTFHKYRNSFRTSGVYSDLNFKSLYQSRLVKWLTFESATTSSLEMK